MYNGKVYSRGHHLWLSVWHSSWLYHDYLLAALSFAISTLGSWKDKELAIIACKYYKYYKEVALDIINKEINPNNPTKNTLLIPSLNKKHYLSLSDIEWSFSSLLSVLSLLFHFLLITIWRRKIKVPVLRWWFIILVLSFKLFISFLPPFLLLLLFRLFLLLICSFSLCLLLFDLFVRGILFSSFLEFLPILGTFSLFLFGAVGFELLVYSFLVSWHWAIVVDNIIIDCWKGYISWVIIRRYNERKLDRKIG